MFVIALYHCNPETDEVRGFRLIDPDDRERWPDDPVRELPESEYEAAFDALVAEAERALGVPGNPEGRGEGELRVRSFRLDPTNELRIAMMHGSGLDSGFAHIAGFASLGHL